MRVARAAGHAVSSTSAGLGRPMPRGSSASQTDKDSTLNPKPETLNSQASLETDPEPGALNSEEAPTEDAARTLALSMLSP